MTRPKVTPVRLFVGVIVLAISLALHHVLTTPLPNRSVDHGCRNNLRNLAIACDAFGSRGDGFPSDLEVLSPEFLSEIPTCGSGEYQIETGPDARLNNERVETYFVIFCPNKKHSNPSRYIYSSAEGIAS